MVHREGRSSLQINWKPQPLHDLLPQESGGKLVFQGNGFQLFSVPEDLLYQPSIGGGEGDDEG